MTEDPRGQIVGAEPGSDTVLKDAEDEAERKRRQKILEQDQANQPIDPQKTRIKTLNLFGGEQAAAIVRRSMYKNGEIDVMVSTMHENNSGRQVGSLFIAGVNGINFAEMEQHSDLAIFNGVRARYRIQGVNRQGLQEDTLGDGVLADTLNNDRISITVWEMGNGSFRVRSYSSMGTSPAEIARAFGVQGD